MGDMPLTLDPATFLSDHWQRTPLLIRGGSHGWVNPLDPDDLAGLAGDPDVEARLVTATGSDWRVEHGPFAAERFANLGDCDWTLLVQAVDHAVPAVAALLNAFAFIPNWRVDDVMVSYAADGGGVGPHFDAYDVFLVQGLGQRRWRVGGPCDAATPLRPHDDLRLLADFTPLAEYVLDPGDILYLPPGIAHDGVAVGGDCMTYSIGFRAPSAADLIGGWADDLLAGLPDERYADPGLTAPANPGEIAPAALADLRALVTRHLADPDAFARWFGAYVSTRKYPDLDWAPAKPVTAATLRRRLAKTPFVARNPASRFAFIRTADGVVLFVDGVVFDCTGDTVVLAEALCAVPRIPIAPQVSDATTAILVALVNTGSITIG